MSGSTIGAVAGAAIGFVASGFNPAGARWGYLIGSSVGDVAMPEGPYPDDSSEESTSE